MFPRYLVFLTCVLAPTFSWAISITNLDKEPHIVQFNEQGKLSETEIAPNATFNREGASMRIRLPGHTAIQTQGGDRFAIWPGPHLSLQQPGNVRRGGNDN